MFNFIFGIIAKILRKSTMIDIKLLQTDFDNVSTALKRKGVGEDILGALKAISEEAKIKRQEMEETTASSYNFV